MDPSRKRKIRLVVALGAAVLLAGGLMYTSFSADTPATTPSQLLAQKGIYSDFVGMREKAIGWKLET